MASTKCPYCGKSSMNVILKMIRGSRKAYKCDSCGKLVGISKWARLLGLAYLASFFIVGLAIEENMALVDYSVVLTLAITTPVWLTLNHFLIPIIPKEKS